MNTKTLVKDRETEDYRELRMQEIDFLAVFNGIDRSQQPAVMKIVQREIRDMEEARPELRNEDFSAGSLAQRLANRKNGEMRLKPPSFNFNSKGAAKSKEVAEDVKPTVDKVSEVVKVKPAFKSFNFKPGAFSR